MQLYTLPRQRSE